MKFMQLLCIIQPGRKVCVNGGGPTYDFWMSLRWEEGQKAVRGIASSSCGSLEQGHHHVRHPTGAAQGMAFLIEPAFSAARDLLVAIWQRARKMCCLRLFAFRL